MAVIPKPADQIGHRKRRGSTGGRPPAFDKDDCRNVVERNFSIFKQWRALATRYDKLAVTYRGVNYETSFPAGTLAVNTEKTETSDMASVFHRGTELNK